MRGDVTFVASKATHRRNAPPPEEVQTHSETSIGPPTARSGSHGEPLEEPPTNPKTGARREARAKVKAKTKEAKETQKLKAKIIQL